MSLTNMLVDGEWRVDVHEPTDGDGEFIRQQTSFRNRISSDSNAEFKAEEGRYHLYISRSCPWSHRTTLARRFNGLEDTISLDVVDPVRKGEGWEFSPEKTGCTEDSAEGTDYLREIYRLAEPTYTGRVTVPVLWDKERRMIVNNESAEILRMLDTGFKDFSRDIDLYPVEYQDDIDRTIDKIWEPINNGVYKAGFADSQSSYRNAVNRLFDELSRWETVLSNQRYLCGPTLSEADICMFPTLVRFDLVYHTHFKCNRKRLIDYPNLWGYTKDLFQLPGIPQTVNIKHIKEGYYREHVSINPKRIIPIGPEVDYGEEHKRDELEGGPPSTLFTDG